MSGRYLTNRYGLSRARYIVTTESRMLGNTMFDGFQWHNFNIKFPEKRLTGSWFENGWAPNADSTMNSKTLFFRFNEGKSATELGIVFPHRMHL